MTYGPVRRVCLSVSFAWALLFGASTVLWARIPVPLYSVDIAGLAQGSTVIFRGKLLDVTMRQEPDAPMQMTRFQVDRWYRRGQNIRDTATVYIQPYSVTMAGNGWSCIDFTSGTDWLVFAKENNGRLELTDDCYGAATVFHLLNAWPARADFLAQLEADFTAGLDDTDAVARIISIQRLGAIRSPASRPALQRVIEGGDPEESKWASAHRRH